MQALMISIRPEWAKLIAEGKKTIELRKSVPGGVQWDKPFKVYVYCTSSRRAMWHHPETGKRLDGRVIGSFICDGIYYAKRSIHGIPVYYRQIIAESCLTEKQLDDYSRGESVHGWHITEFRMWENPKPVSCFGLSRAPQNYAYVEDVG